MLEIVNDAAPYQPKDDSRSLSFAVASLIFGLASIPLLPLLIFGAVALIFGWMAIVRGRRKQSPSKVFTFAAGGILIGGVTVLIGVFDLPTGHGRHGFVLHSKMTANALESGINNYYNEYGVLPKVANRVQTSSPEGVKLLEILLGMEADSGETQNSGDIKFMSVRQTKSNKNGLQYDDSDISIVGLFDAWGNPFTVELDGKNEGRVRFDHGRRTVVLEGRRCAVHSPGKDGKTGTADDIRTW